MYCEDDFIMISALQHYIYCPRQCGLIHVEDAWQDNLFTARGEILHEKVDTDTFETRGDVKTVRGLRIHSYEFGLTGRCDVVEFRKSKDTSEVIPVEYKAGEPKGDISDEVQLCAQALCLEEMLSIRVMNGAFFYGKIRRRVSVELSEILREQTVKVIDGVREIVTSKKAPRAAYSAKCRNCSLMDICQPKSMDRAKLNSYINDLFTV